MSEHHPNYSEFYRQGPYAPFFRAERSVGAHETTLILAQQDAHANSDPATDDLVLGLTLGGKTPARWKAFGRWREIEARRIGALGISPLGERLEFDIAEPHTLLLCSIRSDTVKSFTADADFDALDLLNTGVRKYWYDHLCTNLMQEMWREAVSDDFALKIYLDGLTQALLGRLLHVLDHSVANQQLSPQTKKRLNHARLQEYIRGNIESGFDTNCMAEAMGMTLNEFTKAVKAETGFTPYQLVQNIRIETAKALLTVSQDSLATIAFKTGFSDQSHFTRIFKRIAGTTPAKFKADIGGPN
ncbi:AraC family transcriptional regulator [Pseudaestuariivita rosea]|uniref:AraC family transcriptional regulator n=1 Tax=Pseudaestuariivita rosea TaxID=2763263 RepID=UPI001ABA829E|nr:AraC family transcriptional regulator [Pseudaestuariivita rosea]